MRAAAALVLGIGLGAGGGWMARGPGLATNTGVAALAMQAANAQRAFAADHVHPVEFNAAELPAALGWIGSRLGRPIAPPDLTGAGYRLMGGRMLAEPEGVACLFMYDDDHGTRISVVMRQMRDRDLNAAMRSINDADTFGFAWARDGLGVSLVASKPLPTLHELSDRVRDEMRQL
jgi:anti-sigma factor RsiW